MTTTMTTTMAKDYPIKVGPKYWQPPPMRHAKSFVEESREATVLDAEAELLCKQVWSKYDVDRDGYIQPVELHRILKDLGDNYTLAEVEAAFPRINTSGSGKLNFEEYTNWWRTLNWFDKLAAYEGDVASPRHLPTSIPEASPSIHSPAKSLFARQLVQQPSSPAA